MWTLEKFQHASTDLRDRKKAILLALGEGVGHRLAADSVNAGIFANPAASSLITLRSEVTELVQNHLDAVRDIEEEREEEGLTNGGSVIYIFSK